MRNLSRRNSFGSRDVAFTINYGSNWEKPDEAEVPQEAVDIPGNGLPARFFLIAGAFAEP